MNVRVWYWKEPQTDRHQCTQFQSQSHKIYNSLVGCCCYCFFFCWCIGEMGRERGNNSTFISYCAVDLMCICSIRSEKKLFNAVAHSGSLSVLVTTIKCTQQPIWLLFLWHDFTLKNNPLIWTFKCAITTENQWTLWWVYDVMWCDHLVLAVRLAVLPYTILSFSYSHTLALSVMRAMHSSNIKKKLCPFCLLWANSHSFTHTYTYTYAHVSDVGSLYDSISNSSW